MLYSQPSSEPHPASKPNSMFPLASQANQHHWDNDAVDYHARHRRYLESFYWCPEMLHEKDLQLIGDISGQTVLEIGCGSAPCSMWLAQQYASATVVGFDISNGMLRCTDTGSSNKAASNYPSNLHLVQADVTAMPFAANSFDLAFSVFGALPFVEDLRPTFADIATILKPGGKFIYSINHPMRWIFPDDPSEAGLIAAIPYFEHVYVETDELTVTYIEFQHTFGAHVRALHQAGFTLKNVLEPQWPRDLKDTWGQWSPTRGKIFPGTAIFITQLTQ